MKHFFNFVFCVILLSLATVAEAQQSSFMGIPFGTKYEKAKAEILKRKGAKFMPDISTSTLISVHGLRWGDYNAGIKLSCDEVLGMYEADVLILPPDNDTSGNEATLSQILFNLKAKYGQPTEVNEDEYVWLQSTKHFKLYVRLHINMGLVEVIYGDVNRAIKVKARHDADY